MSDDSSSIDGWDDASASDAIYHQRVAYLQGAAVILLVYDYILTLESEVEFVWKRPKSIVSYLYFIVRYLGVLLAIENAVYTSNLPLSSHQCYVLFELRLWGYFAFGTAMYGIMALRVHALYRHSRKILAFLIVCIVVKKSIQATVYAVVIGPSSGDKEDVDAGVFNCGMSSISVTGIILSSLPAFSFDFVLFVLMLRQFVHHALEMRRLFGRWKTSELMRIMTRDMIVFIFLNPIGNIFCVGGWFNKGFIVSCTATLVNLEPLIVAPRLVTGFRDFYEHSDRVHWCSKEDVELGIGGDEPHHHGTLYTGPSVEMKTGVDNNKQCHS